MGIKRLIFGLIKKRKGYIAEVQAREMWDNLFRSKNKKENQKHNRFDGYTIKRGKRNEERYVVLRYEYPNMGITAVMRGLLFASFVAKKEGYKPLVDYEISRYIRDEELFGKKENNLWERFFEQEPSLEVVLSSNYNATVIGMRIDEAGVYDEDIYSRINGDCDDHRIHFNKMITNECNRLLFRNTAKEYLSFSSDFKKKLTDAYNRYMVNLYLENRNEICIVGVFMREVFSENNKGVAVDDTHKRILSKHPLHPSVDETIREVRKKFDLWKGSYIFISTLYVETISKFQREFGEKNVIYIERDRLTDYQKDEMSHHSSQGKTYHEWMKIEKLNETDYERMETYLTELYLLSRCEYFISGICGAGFIVPLLKDEPFKDVYYIEDLNGGYVYGVR